MNKRNAVHSVLLLCCICLCTYCSKPPDTPVTPVTPPVTTPTTPPPVVPTPPGADFSVDGKWEFQLNGVPYAGTVDTSFVQLLNPSYSHPDTLIQCTGTSFDKKANISFVININRGIFPGNTITTNLGKASFIFDTLSPYYFVSPGNSPLSFQIDSLNGQKLKCTFSGAADQVTNSTPVMHMVTNGKFSCEFGKGTNEPKKFLFNPDANIPYTGYFTRAKIFSNTLVMEGKTYNSGSANFKLLVRTGGTIKPGTYLSSNGDASLQDNSNFYIIDSAGSLSVTITAVSNNIVEGIFSGKDESGAPVLKGVFRCRLKDYTPQPDAADKWAFGAVDYSSRYAMYGGNVLNSIQTQAGGRYYIRVNGESDNGSAVFKIILSASTPLTTGVYANENNSANRLDSVYFRSPARIWDGYISQYSAAVAAFSPFGNPPATTWCSIDAIDASHLSGRLWGKLKTNTSTNILFDTIIEIGKFQASF